MACLACDRIEKISEQRNEFFVAELKESFAVAADDQRYTGHTILLLKHHAEHLHRLERETRSLLFQDVILVGDALAEAFRPIRINYECLGNSMPHIHWHVIPRYEWDPQPTHPIWVRPKGERAVGVTGSDLKAIVSKLRSRLAKIGGSEQG